MKNGLLVCAPSSHGKNIGDYIQSVAQEQFFEHIDCYVEREKINSFDSNEITNVIMNAWWMWNPQNFPPSPSINPLFVSFHLVPAIAEQFFTKKTIAYLKEQAPIGARDLGTMELMLKHGIDSYFSGCLTLTLGEKYKSIQKNDNVIFVDPYFPIAGMRITRFNIIGYLKAFYFLIKNYKKASRLAEHFVVESRTIFRYVSQSFEKKYVAASFYEYYSSIFEDEILFNAEYITHNVVSSKFNTNDEWMDYARKLVCKYAQARLVVTSRIHCGLPCLGLETPCIFVTSDILQGNSLRSSGRFSGLIELFNIAKWTPSGIHIITESLKKTLNNNGKLDITKIPIRDEYVPIKNQLIKTIKNFTNNK